MDPSLLSTGGAPAPDTAPWHAWSVERTRTALGAPAVGLSESDAAGRLARDGPNRLSPPVRRSPSRLFLAQFNDFMIRVLLGAALVAGLLGDRGDAAAILAIVLLNAGVGFVQEFRAERALDALREIDAPTARVERDGRRRLINADGLVRGDRVILEAGARVPADLRLSEAQTLRIDESALTGESAPVEKNTDPLPIKTEMADRTNMAYRGTLVVHGRGAGTVAATGSFTALGRVAALLSSTERVPTPLQRRLAVFGRRLAAGALGLCAVVFAAGLLRGEPPLLMFLTAVSLAVAAIPEALPAVVTLALALGAQKMARVKALVRRLPAIETLGSVTVIATDKTGTLTQNKMRAESFYWDGALRSELSLEGTGGELARALALCNDARPDRDGRPVGDPTEVALLEAAVTAGVEPAGAEARTGERPFDAHRKRMTTFHPEGADSVGYTKGSPEGVLSLCGHLWDPAGPQPLPREALARVADALAEGGQRVLAFARRSWPAPPTGSTDVVERDLSFLGFVGLVDPPRPGVAHAVAAAAAAGVRTVMITGDHPFTAAAIARRLGFPDGDTATGAQLASWTPAERVARLPGVVVFARVTPEQKLDIVTALQAGGQVVAVTGDGVNDAPALQRADIGIAMGRSGTDAAKEAAALLLLDDDFSTIVRAIREGRRIFDNIRLFVKYVVTTNAAEIGVLLLAPFLGLPLPLTPIQLLWLNLLTDGLPGLALASESTDGHAMARPPRPPSEPLVTRALAFHIGWVSALMTGMVLTAQAAFLRSGWAEWRTAVFCVMCFSQMGHALVLRSERDSFFSRRGFSNRPLLAAVGLTVVLQILGVYWAPLQRLLQTAPLSPRALAGAVGASVVVFAAVELEKGLRRWRART
ncbi:MAG TPA: cation-translocating P-type ATPase [Elusimicrobiota bacterium]|nr:cation-translocating P-type ATPase [Elusimicrobiota bacterium]